LDSTGPNTPDATPSVTATFSGIHGKVASATNPFVNQILVGCHRFRVPLVRPRLFLDMTQYRYGFDPVCDHGEFSVYALTTDFDPLTLTYNTRPEPLVTDPYFNRNFRQSNNGIQIDANNILDCSDAELVYGMLAQATIYSTPNTPGVGDPDNQHICSVNITAYLLSGEVYTRAVISRSSVGTVRTLKFAEPHGIYFGTSLKIKVVGVGDDYDVDDFTDLSVTVVDSTTITYSSSSLTEGTTACSGRIEFY
jgi:hypothetical protein